MSIACLAVAIVGGATTMRTVIVDAGVRRDEARDEQAASEARRDELRDALASARASLVRTSQARHATATATSAATEDAAAERSAADLLRISLFEKGSQLANTSNRLDDVLRRVEETTNAVDALRFCLNGVADAAQATRAGEQSAALRALQSVTDACRRAQVATGRVDPTVRFPFDFPDPYVIAADGTHFAYATNSAGGAVQMLRSDDLIHWSFAGTALSSVPGWAVPGATWAPSVLQRSTGWVMYYSVTHRGSGRQCISVATATGPAGPFRDSSAAPLVCNLAEGGSIDPSPFVATDGVAHLLWKDEGETIGRTASIRAQRLAPDGQRLEGTPRTLLRPDRAWEGRTVEGPSMVATPAGLVLLYSANRWDTAAYAVGAARCDSPTGPCHKLGKVLSTTGSMVGPGGAEAFVDRNGTLRATFHAWQGHAVGYPDSRYLHLATLSISNGRVHATID